MSSFITPKKCPSTPEKWNSFRSTPYTFDAFGKITNFNDVDLMRGNKLSKMSTFEESTGFKKIRKLQYFLPYSTVNKKVLEKYGDAHYYYYYRPINVVVSYLPSLKEKLGPFDGDFDENLLRTKISDDETRDTSFFMAISKRCKELKLEIDGIYSPAASNMHDEVILFDPRQLIESGQMEILSLHF